jgi:hypothetical protein
MQAEAGREGTPLGARVGRWGGTLLDAASGTIDHDF